MVALSINNATLLRAPVTPPTGRAAAVPARSPNVMTEANTVERREEKDGGLHGAGCSSAQRAKKRGTPHAPHG